MNKMQIMPQIAWRDTTPPIGTTTSPALKRLMVRLTFCHVCRTLITLDLFLMYSLSVRVNHNV